MPCRIDDLAQHLLSPKGAQRGRVIQTRVAELCDSVDVRVEERSSRNCVDLGQRCGVEVGVLAGDDRDVRQRLAMPATSRAAGIGRTRSEAGSTGLPSKSVTTKRPRLRST